MMNIEQIADAVSQEMLMHVATLQPELVKWNREYLRRCLSKLAEQSGAEPVAFINHYNKSGEQWSEMHYFEDSDADYSVAIYTEAQFIGSRFKEPNYAVSYSDPDFQPVSCEFQTKDGKWHHFIDELHYERTVADGSWPIRRLYTEDQLNAAFSIRGAYIKMIEDQLDKAREEIKQLQSDFDIQQGQLGDALDRLGDMATGDSNSINRKTKKRNSALQMLQSL